MKKDMKEENTANIREKQSNELKNKHENKKELRKQGE